MPSEALRTVDPPGPVAPPRARIVEALATGAWLGLLQVDLGFSLTAGAGAAATLFFALTAVWLAGSAGGVLLGTRLPGRALLLGALAVGAAGRALLALAPFSPAAVAVVLLAGFLGGGYAGVFFATRARVFGEVRRLFLHENNGFLLGYLAAVALLLVRSPALDGAVVVLGVALALGEGLVFSSGRRVSSRPRRSS